MDEDVASTWAAIAAAYAAGDLTVAQICTRYGISKNALYARARKQGWPKRRAGPQSRQRRGKSPPARQSARQALIARLYRALEQKMSELETRVGDGAQTVADHERETRTLNTMVRLFERLGALEEKAKADDVASRDDVDISADARSLRKDLARRLERLQGEHGA